MSVAAEPGRGQPEATFLDALPQAVFVLDAEGRLASLNSRAQEVLLRLTGQSREQLLGRVVWSACPEVAESVLARQCAQARAEGRAVEQETFYPALGRWFAVHVAPSAGHLVVSLQDITEPWQPGRGLAGCSAGSASPVLPVQAKRGFGGYATNVVRLRARFYDAGGVRLHDAPVDFDPNWDVRKGERIRISIPLPAEDVRRRTAKVLLEKP
jgi:PAS domain S-box-containing protein